MARSVGISEESHLDPKLELLKMNTVEAKKMEAKLENEALIQKINYSVVAGGFHSGEISCLDICV
jgi:hypothetical protein